MMSNNKILTVSYGTFSCTLEGFDDSFGTMKAIAEYFRGLSSDAPYFGAEPPQPDADMLARIAQREISRRVEAREHEGKIHLSAKEESDADKEEAPRALASDVTTPAAVAAAVVAPAARVEAKLEEEPAAPTPLESDDSGTDGTDAPEDADVMGSTDAVEVDDLHDDTEAEADQEAEFVEDENDIVPGQRDADVEAFFANSAKSTAHENEDEDMPVEASVADTAQTAPQNDTIAAKLQRIRAVVASQEDTKEDDDYAEDQHADASVDATQVTGAAEDAADQADDMMEDARRDIEDALDADEAQDATSETVEDDDDDIAAILSRLDASDNTDTSAKADVIFPQTSDDTQVDDALDNLFGQDDSDDDVDASKPAHLLETRDATPEASDAPALRVEQEDAPQARSPRARVIKVKRADLEAAIERGDLEEYDNEDEAAAPSLDDLAPAKKAETSLSAEDEAELARELAALEADMSFDEGDQDDLATMDGADHEAKDEEVAEDKPAAAPQPRIALPTFDDEAGDDMNRLMAETDHQMDEPESATRRDAFAHLRAAVAAKKADVAMGAQDDDKGEDNAYRNDLADVVRPRRPVSGASRTERPGDTRPAPLKLVAEQRIDVERPRPAGPVRPRRVATMTETVSTAPEGESFADYAAEVGATKLPQLLEAAAAYMSFVEGREQFSRPQLMTKVRQVGPEDGFSREDGLRSFGQLLRAGKIEKIKGGRFTVSEDIGYQPDQRAAG